MKIRATEWADFEENQVTRKEWEKRKRRKTKND